MLHIKFFLSLCKKKKSIVSTCPSEMHVETVVVLAVNLLQASPAYIKKYRQKT